MSVTWEQARFVAAFEAGTTAALAGGLKAASAQGLREAAAADKVLLLPPPLVQSVDSQTASGSDGGQGNRSHTAASVHPRVRISDAAAAALATAMCGHDHIPLLLPAVGSGGSGFVAGLWPAGDDGADAPASSAALAVVPVVPSAEWPEVMHWHGALARLAQQWHNTADAAATHAAFFPAVSATLLGFPGALPALQGRVASIGRRAWL